MSRGLFVPIPEDPPIPREPQEPDRWLRSLVPRLYLLFQSLARRMNQVMAGRFGGVLQLPPPDAEDRGRIVWVRAPAGAGDTLHWMRRTRQGALSWERVALYADFRASLSVPALAAGATSVLVVTGVGTGRTEDPVVVSFDPPPPETWLVRAQQEAGPQVRLTILAAATGTPAYNGQVYGAVIRTYWGG